MAIDGDDYTYPAVDRHICTAADHQTAQDTRIAELELDMAQVQANILQLRDALRVTERMIHKLLNHGEVE